MILFIEDAITPQDTASAFADSGLVERVHVHGAGADWPTLGALVARDERVLVLAEEDGGSPAWYHEGFDLVQDTPFSVPAPERFSCRRARGRPGSPLLLLNHWIDRPVPVPRVAREINAGEVLGERVERCGEARGQRPNLVAVDFYDEGDLLDVVDELNR